MEKKYCEENLYAGENLDDTVRRITKDMQVCDILYNSILKVF